MSDKEYKLILAMIIAICLFVCTAVIAVQDTKSACYKSASVNTNLVCEK